MIALPIARNSGNFQPWQSLTAGVLNTQNDFRVFAMYSDGFTLLFVHSHSHPFGTFADKE